MKNLKITTKATFTVKSLFLRHESPSTSPFRGFLTFFGSDFDFENVYFEAVMGQLWGILWSDKLFNIEINASFQTL